MSAISNSRLSNSFSFFEHADPIDTWNEELLKIDPTQEDDQKSCEEFFSNLIDRIENISSQTELHQLEKIKEMIHNHPSLLYSPNIRSNYTLLKTLLKQFLSLRDIKNGFEILTHAATSESQHTKMLIENFILILLGKERLRTALIWYKDIKEDRNLKIHLTPIVNFFMLNAVLSTQPPDFQTAKNLAFEEQSRILDLYGESDHNPDHEPIKNFIELCIEKKYFGEGFSMLSWIPNPDVFLSLTHD